MTLQELLTLFGELDTAVAPGALAKVRGMILATWPDVVFVEAPAPVAIRALPSETPFYIDVLTESATYGVTIELRGVPIRVTPEDADQRIRERWTRSGFTLRERFAALQSLSHEIVPFRRTFSGVRKYRSIEAANADREARPRPPNS